MLVLLSFMTWIPEQLLANGSGYSGALLRDVSMLVW